MIASGHLCWKRGEVVLLLLCAAPPTASLLGRTAFGTLWGTTGPWSPGAPSPQPPPPPAPNPPTPTPEGSGVWGNWLLIVSYW